MALPKYFWDDADNRIEAEVSMQYMQGIQGEARNQATEVSSLSGVRLHDFPPGHHGDANRVS